jgi:hypothetical protein
MGFTISDPGELQIPNSRRRIRRQWLVAAALICAPILLYFCSRFFPSWIEKYYSRGIYPYIGRAAGFFSGLIPFSIAEFIAICLIALTPFLIGLYVRGLRHRTRRWTLELSNLTRRAMCLVGAFALLFQVLWGLNYGRLPLAKTLAFDQSPVGTTELEAAAREIVSRTNDAYHDAHGQISTAGSDDSDSIRRSIENSYAANRLLPWQASLSGYSRPKPVLLHNVMTRFGIAGVYSPFTAEPNYIASLPGFDVPFTMAHEMAHARGFAREDEADFVAYLICTTSSDARLRYSGYLAGLRVLSQLATVDINRYRDLAKLIEDGPRRDLKTRYEFWASFRGPATYVGNRVNDIYLKANGIKSGVRNYDEMSALIIGYFRRLKSTSTAQQNLELALR